jgi:hypothetical protein
MSEMNQPYEPFRWADPAIKERAEAERQESQKRLEDAQRTRAAHFEGELKARYLATGATEAEWQREKDAVLTEARKQAALTGEDVPRSANRARYG